MVAAIDLYATRLRQRGVRVQIHPAKTPVEAYLSTPPEGAVRIVLDETGDAPDSLAFAMCFCTLLAQPRASAEQPDKLVCQCR